MGTQQIVWWKDLGLQRYKPVWDEQERLMQLATDIKRAEFEQPAAERSTQHHLLLVEHPPVYTLGKSGHIENILISEAEMAAQDIDYFKINRGGDITFHGPQQLVGYPILDLEKMYTDIGRYLRNLEEVIIKTIAHYGLKGERSAGETGVWLDPDKPGHERKICAMGVRCSRWITMHGWALNVNTDLTYFDNIIPCGIVGKQVTSIAKELGHAIDFEESKQVLLNKFAEVFEVELQPMG
ncbi:lipoyl(octanoyl) transferase LipB [Phnomibacter ginsenosidimutans]|uniref:Octanoyltransferase n=1 Tax=Phnomibacter ginsenosidimutans TaxID=2676868 RepID=A0A6I6H1W6_9BACT|nr:lipoyl(octanoyl) transferase LipB [Phnomibacter ginsenosidimutans]QGW28611.1 lipoyl(octanoyl) transferase LipB [Phnomibacter ginsenosidimutans]